MQAETQRPQLKCPCTCVVRHSREMEPPSCEGLSWKASSWHRPDLAVQPPAVGNTRPPTSGHPACGSICESGPSCHLDSLFPHVLSPKHVCAPSQAEATTRRRAGWAQASGLPLQDAQLTASVTPSVLTHSRTEDNRKMEQNDQEVEMHS